VLWSSLANAFSLYRKDELFEVRKIVVNAFNGFRTSKRLAIAT
jgi:hypothetical protein